MRRGFTLVEVMVAVTVISVVIGVLLQLYSSNTTLFSSMRGHSELCMRSSLLIGNTLYGYEDDKTTLAELVSGFEIDDDLRRQLKQYEVQISYFSVKKLDEAQMKTIEEGAEYYGADSEALQEHPMEFGRTSFQMDEFETAYLRLKLQ